MGSLFLSKADETTFVGKAPLDSHLLTNPYLHRKERKYPRFLD